MRLTVLQALHGAMCVAGGRMSEKHKTEILTTLLTLHSTAQVRWKEEIGVVWGGGGGNESRSRVGI